MRLVIVQESQTRGQVKRHRAKKRLLLSLDSFYYAGPVSFPSPIRTRYSFRVWLLWNDA